MNTRTDFADELVNNGTKKEYEIHSKRKKDCTMKIVDILKEPSSFKKPKGRYISIEFPNLMDDSIRKRVSSLLLEGLKNLYPIKQKDRVLIIGLGNEKVMADALGPICADKIMVTNHLFSLFPKEEIDKELKRVCVFTPKVMGQTGLESADIIMAIQGLFHADLVIVVDALASSSLTRINKVIQVSNTGIAPGSGVGNYRKEINEKTLKCKVIAIGVATVVLANQIIKEIDASFSLPNDSSYDLVLTPKEIDEDITHLSTLLATSINTYIHENFQSM